MRRVQLPLQRLRQRPRLGVIEQQDCLHNSLEQPSPRSVRQRRRLQDCPHGAEGSPSKSPTTPQVLLTMRDETKEVCEALTAREPDLLAIWCLAEYLRLCVGRDGQHLRLLRVDYESNTRCNLDQPVQLTLGASGS